MNQPNSFNPENQLKKLIENYPRLRLAHKIKVDICGVLLDYIGRTGIPLTDILLQNIELKKYLFSNNFEYKKTYTLFYALYKDSPSRSFLREFAHKHDWSDVIKLIDEIDSKEIERGNPSTGSFCDTLVGHHVEGVIWQLSDIHFGKLNLLGFNAEDLAETLRNCCTFHDEALTPNLILISGDITSQAASEEFDEFNSFCDFLCEGIWGDKLFHRILTVPGNHDVTWTETTADKLRSFVTRVSRANKCVTPFWDGNRNYTDSIGPVTINKFESESEDVPPFVLVTDKKLNLQILLLTSSYYSGTIPVEVISTLQNIEDTSVKDSLSELLRVDTGEISRGFIFHISKSLRPVDRTTFALTHHNLDSYGERPVLMPYKEHLLKTLYDRNVMLILHGHTHLTETSDSGRTPNQKQAFPIPCPTLCSDNEPGSNWGFLVHFIGSNNGNRVITTYIWEIDANKFFSIDPSRLKPLYQFNIHTNNLSVNYIKPHY